MPKEVLGGIGSRRLQESLQQVIAAECFTDEGGRVEQVDGRDEIEHMIDRWWFSCKIES